MRTALRTAAVAALLVLVGCGAGPTGPAGDTAAEPTTTGPTDDPGPTTTTPPEWASVDYDPQGPPPEPPERLAPEAVRNVAAQAEATRLYDRLSNDSELREYGVAGYTVQPGAYVVARNDTAAVVRVRLGYSYECGASIADLVSRATYRVSTDAVTRLDGPTVDPVC
jgi:hypothetical protein